MEGFGLYKKNDIEFSAHDFFSAIVSGAVTTEESIISILKARGFFLDNIDGKWYLSDNAHKDDISYLAEGFEKYALGKIIPINRDNVYAEIIVSDEADLEDAISFFNEKNYISFSIMENSKPWGMLVNHSYGMKVPLSILEPFVARYVKAISSCGVTTSLSCDGNDEGQHYISVHSEYPYSIWHKLICDCFIPDEYGIRFNDEGDWHFTKKTKYIQYLHLNQAAEYLYRNRKRIREIKSKACSTINASKLKHLTGEELHTLFIMNIKNTLQELSIE